MPLDQLSRVPPRKIAVIGTGVAGMSAAWLLSQRHRVSVFERENRIGGHSNTVDARTIGGPVAVDTGFIVYNEVNYPNLTALFDYLRVPTKESEMSFSASLGGGALEYAGTNVNGLFGQRINLMRPRFWRMMRDLLRFYREAPDVLGATGSEDISLGEYCAGEGYGEAFMLDHLLPMGAAIWSTSAAEMRAYPVKSFVRFFVSHGLLNLVDRPQWRTVDGGSREYVARLTRPYADDIRHGGVAKVRRLADKVIVVGKDGAAESFDDVVIATHADEALALLDDPWPLETELLGAWRYTANRAVLHTDDSLMPRRRRVWSSWNFIGAPGEEERVCVTYWMNRLQSLTSTENLFVTLNPNREPARERVFREMTYTHPYFDRAAIATQDRLWSLQGLNRTWFCGSYFGYGFHEDALQSGLAVAEQLGGMRRPWRVDDENGRITVKPVSAIDVAVQAA